MKLRMRRWALILSLAAVTPLAIPQDRQQQPPSAERESDATLPNGKSQRDEILKSEHEQNIKDAQRLADLADELREELEKGDRFVLSVGVLKKTDEIEKLARKIRSRLRHN